MKLNTKTDYCIRVLIYLQENKKRVRIQEIAEAYDISKNHLSVAVNKLSELGYILSTPGPKGGIEFNETFGKKRLSELVSQLEHFDIVECFNVETNKCNISPSCKLKSILGKANHSFLNELKKHKISDLV